MEVKEPKAKFVRFDDPQPSLPIVIQSEIESLKNGVVTGVHEGRSVVVRSPADMKSLYDMGNFGKGSGSRSRPADGKMPRFMRERQYVERLKWTDIDPCKLDADGKEITYDRELIERLHSTMREMMKRGLVQSSDSVIDILSSDEESASDPLFNVNSESLSFPDRSVVVLPDSDSETDDYFKDLHPKLCMDDSDFSETLVLSLEEAYFLAYGLGCLQIQNSREHLTLEESWSAFCTCQPDFPFRYAVYHYFRSKGWIVKPGIKFGGDFLLYKRGQMYYHASYVVIICSSNKDICPDQNWLSVQNSIRLSAVSAKEILFANVALLDNVDIQQLKSGPSMLKNISVAETLVRRWTPNQK